MKVRVRVLPLTTIILFGCLALGAQAARYNRILLQDVTVLTLQAGAKTAGRRSSPIPQLQCRGRNCKSSQPQTVQCRQTGWDGNDAQWRCEADLPSWLSLGSIQVNCEGYDYPDDPYILSGSCGLTYELIRVDRPPERAHRGLPPDDYEDSFIGSAISFILFGLVTLFLVWSCCCNSVSRRGGGSSGDPPPYDDSWYPRFSQEPPTSRCAPPTGTSSAANGPGFFTGMGLGGLAGYLLGNRNRPSRLYTAPPHEPAASSSTGWFSSEPSAPAPEPSATRRATGYATTTRR